MKKTINTIGIFIIYSFVLICCGKSDLSQSILGSDIKRKTKKDPSYSEQRSQIRSLYNFKDYNNTDDEIKNIFGNDMKKFNLLCNEDKKENIYRLSYYKKSGNYGINRNNNLPTNSVFDLRIPFLKNIRCNLYSYELISSDNKFIKDINSLFKNFSKTQKINKPSDMLVYRYLLEKGIGQKKLNNDIVKTISLYSFEVYDDFKEQKNDFLMTEYDDEYNIDSDDEYNIDSDDEYNIDSDDEYNYKTCLKEYEEYIKEVRLKKITDNLETVCKFIDPYLKIDEKLLCVGYIRHYSNLFNKFIPTDIIKLIDKLYDNPKRKIHGKMYEEKEIIMNCSLYETPDILYIKVPKNIFESFHFSYFNGDQGKFYKYDEASDRLTKTGFLYYLMFIQNPKLEDKSTELTIPVSNRRYRIHFNKMYQMNTETEFKSDILCSLSKNNTISS